MAASDKPPLLGSWKEIAAFFGRDVRTAQRWEREGLPVRRRPGAGRSGVFADPAELEAWLQGRSEPGGPLDQPTPASAAPHSQTSRARLRFVGMAIALLAAVISLSWIAAAREPRPPRDSRGLTLATSVEPLSTPRWGNVDGDDRPDLLVTLHPSTALIFLGAGSASCGRDARDCADVRVTAPPECLLHSSQLSDLNGDGIDDLAVSCQLREPASLTSTGPTFLLWGRASLPRDILLPRDADVTIDADSSRDDRMHTCLAAQGSPDLNGDGIADLLVGAVEAPFMDRMSSGAVYVFFGRRHWVPRLRTAQADLAIHGARTGEGLGGQCATGDFDGDGREEIAINADEHRLWGLLGGKGRTYLVQGRADWPREIDLAVEPVMRIEGRTPRVEKRQTALVDLDGDGRAELVVSAPGQTGQPQYGGRVGIWRGAAISPGVRAFDEADIVIEGHAAGRLGAAFDAADFDDDGMPELIVSESGHGALLSLRPLTPHQRSIDAAGLVPVARFNPTRSDDSGESAFAIGGDLIAQVSRSDEELWKLTLHQPLAEIAIDVRPYFDDDVMLKPGVVVVGIARGKPWPEPVLDTLRANGARSFAHAADDFNGDGTPDILAYFRTDEMRLAGQTVTLVVTGRDRDGAYVRGSALVRVVVAIAER